MELRNKFNLDELIYAEHVKGQEPSQEQGNPSVVLVVVQDSKQFGKDHLWYNKYVETVME